MTPLSKMQERAEWEQVAAKIALSRTKKDGYAEWSEFVYQQIKKLHATTREEVLLEVEAGMPGETIPTDSYGGGWNDYRKKARAHLSSLREGENAGQ